MKNLTSSLLAKIVAVFLASLLFLSCLATGAAVVLAADGGMYMGDDDFFESNWCQNRLSSATRSVYREYLQSETPITVDDAFRAELRARYEDTNFLFAVTLREQPDTVLFGNYTGQKTAAHYTYETGDFIIQGYLNAELTQKDDFYWGKIVFQKLYDSRYHVLAGLLFGGLLFLATIIFLLCAAGHRRDQPGVTLNMQDKIPLDLYLGVAVFILGLVISLLVEGFALASVGYVVLFVGLMLIVFLTLLATLLTCATRLKAGRWWENTFILRALRIIRRLARRLGHGVMAFYHLFPMVWRTVAVFCGITFINFILALSFFEGGGDFSAFFLGLMFNVLLLVCLVLVSQNLQRLYKAGEQLAAGNFDTRVDVTRMFWDFRRHGEHLNGIGDGLSIAVEQRMRSERLKTELITNVSHDLKTPLTSIINYVDLMSQEEMSEKAIEYRTVLERQAKRLKKLTEDLLEAAKASSGNLAVELKRTDVTELINQSLGEYAGRMEQSRLTPVFSGGEEPIHILADGRLMWRVLDNLLGNACKYAQPDTRVYIDVRRVDREVAVNIKNISRDRLNIGVDELMERFVRGDAARTGEGSGLGLSIVRSLVELQKGVFSLAVDGDLFKAEMRFLEEP